jgi:hypothetical protein
MTFMWIQLWGGLPLAVFIGLVVAARQGGLSWLEAGLRTVPLWAALTWLLTNGLSYGDVLTPSALKVAWGVIAVVAALYAASRYRRGHAQLSAFQLKSLTPFEWVLVTATGGIGSTGADYRCHGPAGDHRRAQLPCAQAVDVASAGQPRPLCYG